MPTEQFLKLVHGSTIAVAGRAALIVGPSGAGKSSLALDLISRGAALVADDQTLLQMEGGLIKASAPAELLGLIEAHRVGLIRIEFVRSAELALVIDLDESETERLPPPRCRRFFGIEVDLVLGRGNPFLAGAALALLEGKRFA